MGRMNYHGNESLEEAVFQAFGFASSCWENVERAGVFQSDLAKEAAEELIAHIKRLSVPTEPSLGLATTKQLLEELEARFGSSEEPTLRFMSGQLQAWIAHLPESVLSYRTVDS